MTGTFTGTAGAGVTRKIGLFGPDHNSGFWFGDVDGQWVAGRIYDGT